MLETLYNHSDTDERCGLILTDGTVVEIDNIAEDKEAGYHMDPEQVLPHLSAGTIKGTWHTHPRSDPNLSGADHDAFQSYPDLEHSIVGWVDGEVLVMTYKVDNGLVVVCD